MTDASESLSFMQLALSEAKLAFAAGEVPVGAVLVRDSQVIAKAHNTREQHKNPLFHAEIKLLQEGAVHQGDWRLNDYEMYVTLEPCPMCLGALFQARVGKIYIGCFDEKRMESALAPERNAFVSLKSRLEKESPLLLTSNNHTLSVQGGILEEECRFILKDFFKSRRQSR